MHRVFLNTWTPSELNKSCVFTIHDLLALEGLGIRIE
jgi:hypothetical protein